MKKRNSMIFGKKTELKNHIELKIITRFPEKWILIDSETSQVYSGNNNLKMGNNWNKIIDKPILKKISDLLKSFT